MTVRRGRSAAARSLVLAAATAGLLVGSGQAAWGHAAFVASQPEPGSRLSTAPGVVVVRFSEPLIEELSGATVRAPTGQEFEGAASGEREIQVRLPTNAHGEYTVDWKTVSPLDGHTLRGRFRFGVGVDVGPEAGPSNAPSASDLAVALARVVEYAGLLGGLGWLTIGALARRRELDWVPRGLSGWVLAGAAGGATVVGGELLLAGTGSLGATARAFLTASSGLPRLLRVGTELVAVAAVVVSARRRVDGRPGPAARWWVAGLLVTTLFLLAASGHAAGVAPAVLGVFADGAHLVAAGAWAGSIAAMALHRPPGGWRGEPGRTLLRAFPRVAIPAFAATVVFGSVRSFQELASLSDLWTTGYGQILLLKIVFVTAMLPLSWRAFQAGHPRPRVEAPLALAVVAAAAVLAAFPVPPGRAEHQARASDAPAATDALPRRGDLTMAAGAGDTVVGLTLRPGEPGINDVYVHLVPVQGEDAAGDLRATLAVAGGQPQRMERCGTPCRVTTATLQGGEAVEVALSGLDDGTATFTLPALPAPDGRSLLEQLTERMDRVGSWTYLERLGPVDPPVESRWAIDEPRAVWGAVDSPSGYYERLHIGNRTWNRQVPDAAWELTSSSAQPVGDFPFIWAYPGRTAPRIVGSDTVGSTPARILSFFVDVGDQPIWYRLWVDDQGLVHRAVMLAQGHFMEHTYRHFDAPLRIEPPPVGYQPPP